VFTAPAEIAGKACWEKKLGLSMGIPKNKHKLNLLN